MSGEDQLMKLLMISIISNDRCVKKSKDKNGEEQVNYLLIKRLPVDFVLRPKQPVGALLAV